MGLFSSWDFLDSQVLVANLNASGNVEVYDVSGTLTMPLIIKTFAPRSKGAILAYVSGRELIVVYSSGEKDVYDVKTFEYKGQKQK